MDAEKCKIGSQIYHVITEQAVSYLFAWITGQPKVITSVLQKFGEVRKCAESVTGNIIETKTGFKSIDMSQHNDGGSSKARKKQKRKRDDQGATTLEDSPGSDKENVHPATASTSGNPPSGEPAMKCHSPSCLESRQRAEDLQKECARLKREAEFWRRSFEDFIKDNTGMEQENRQLQHRVVELKTLVKDLQERYPVLEQLQAPQAEVQVKGTREAAGRTDPHVEVEEELLQPEVGLADKGKGPAQADAHVELEKQSPPATALTVRMKKGQSSELWPYDDITLVAEEGLQAYREYVLNGKNLPGSTKPLIGFVFKPVDDAAPVLKHVDDEPNTDPDIFPLDNSKMSGVVPDKEEETPSQFMNNFPKREIGHHQQLKTSPSPRVGLQFGSMINDITKAGPSREPAPSNALITWGDVQAGPSRETALSNRYITWGVPQPPKEPSGRPGFQFGIGGFDTGPNLAPEPPNPFITPTELQGPSNGISASGGKDGDEFEVAGKYIVKQVLGRYGI
ncbi:hypothetical protein HDV00_010600 [Rhizophlyctis rosea]|nr:hypothetical protein HDV00_010600 [Rhizophlyctis rosea]